jgi:hypothetical protein
MHSRRAPATVGHFPPPPHLYCRLFLAVLGRLYGTESILLLGRRVGSPRLSNSEGQDNE